MSRILVIDDEPAISALLKNIFEKYKFLVDACNFGEDAVVQSSHTKYDLIISDISMPVLNGVETIKKIRTGELNKTTPVIFITGSTGEEIVKEAWTLQPFEIMSKPITDIKAIVEKARAAISKEDVLR